MTVEAQDFIEILDEQISDESTSEEKEINTDGLSPQEKEMAEKHGIIKSAKKDEKETDKDKTEVKGIENIKKVEDETIENEDGKKKTTVEDIEHSNDLDDTFDKMAEDTMFETEKLSEFSKKDKAFYHKWKKDKQKRQEYEASSEMLKIKLKQAELELQALKNKPADIDSLLDDEEKKAKEKEPLTRAEYEANEKAKYENDIKIMQRRQRLDAIENEYRSKYEDFDEMIKVAEPIIRTNKLYNEMYMKEANDPNGNPGEFVYRLGKLNSIGKDVKKKEVEIEEHETKKQTSASLPSSPAQKVKRINYDDLTIKDVANFTDSQWRALPRKVRDKLLAS